MKPTTLLLSIRTYFSTSKTNNAIVINYYIFFDKVGKKMFAKKENVTKINQTRSNVHKSLNVDNSADKAEKNVVIIISVFEESSEVTTHKHL